MGAGMQQGAPSVGQSGVQMGAPMSQPQGAWTGNSWPGQGQANQSSQGSPPSTSGSTLPAWLWNSPTGAAMTPNQSTLGGPSAPTLKAWTLNSPTGQTLMRNLPPQVLQSLGLG